MGEFIFLPQHALTAHEWDLLQDPSVPTSYDLQLPLAHLSQLYPATLLSALLIVPSVFDFTFPDSEEIQASKSC